MSSTNIYTHDVIKIQLSPQQILAPANLRTQKIEITYADGTYNEISCFGCPDMAPITVLLPEETPDA